MQFHSVVDISFFKYSFQLKEINSMNYLKLHLSIFLPLFNNKAFDLIFDSSDSFRSDSVSCKLEIVNNVKIRTNHNFSTQTHTQNVLIHEIVREFASIN